MSRQPSCRSTLCQGFELLARKGAWHGTPLSKNTRASSAHLVLTVRPGCAYLQAFSNLRERARDVLEVPANRPMAAAQERQLLAQATTVRAGSSSVQGVFFCISWQSTGRPQSPQTCRSSPNHATLPYQRCQPPGFTRSSSCAPCPLLHARQHALYSTLSRPPCSCPPPQKVLRLKSLRSMGNSTRRRISRQPTLVQIEEEGEDDLDDEDEDEEEMGGSSPVSGKQYLTY